MPGGRPVTPSDPPPVPVTLRNGAPLPLDLRTRVIGLYILHLLKHDFSANERVVLRKLGIDRATRRRTGRDLGAELHDYRWMNKALAMELLTALLLSRIDSPARVNSQCLLDEYHGLPYTFAPPKTADVIARYAPGSTGETFGIVVEASAKRDVTLSNFETQLRQAIDRARELREEIGAPVYALVINGAPVASSAAYAGSYRKMLHQHGIVDDPSLCLVAMDANDLGVAYCDLVSRPPGDGLHFRTEQLRGVLDALYAGLQQTEMLSKEDWMRNTWSSLGADGATPTLPLPQEADGDGTDVGAG